MTTTHNSSYNFPLLNKVNGLPIRLDLWNQHRGILIVGQTGAGKTTLLKGIVAQALRQHLPVFGLEWYRPLVRNTDKPSEKISLQPLSVVLQLNYDEWMIRQEPTLALDLIDEAIERATSAPQSVLFIDDGDALVAHPKVVQRIHSLCPLAARNGMTIILVAQLSERFSNTIISDILPH